MKKPNGQDYSDAYKKNILNALLAASKYHFPEAHKAYADKRDEFKAVLDAQQFHQQLTTRQEKNIVSWDQILSVKERLPKDSEEFVLLSLYTDLPPVRADWSPMRILSTELEASEYEGNCLVVNHRECIVHLNEYKTSKAYGPIVHRLPEPLSNILRSWCFKHSRHWLFQLADGTPWTPAYLSRKVTAIFQRILKKNVGITMIRIAHNTEQGKNDRTIAEKSNLAKLMGHSILQGEKYSKKY